MFPLPCGRLEIRAGVDAFANDVEEGAVGEDEAEGSAAVGEGEGEVTDKGLAVAAAFLGAVATSFEAWSLV